ncbi:hypothetical protein AB6A40_002361 [Gnathostoma spinigerum]|uniref:Ribosomal protein S14 n=1 Tax=Gnathostoma spinigerum TaxID=75299 RepID=A0ABD6EGH4_9BILA
MLSSRALVRRAHGIIVRTSRFFSSAELGSETRTNGNGTADVKKDCSSPKDELSADVMLDEVGKSASQAYGKEAFKALKLDEYPYYVEREWWKEGTRMTFWSTWRMLRDIRRRQAVKETAFERLNLKLLKCNTILPQVLRDEWAAQLHNMPKRTFPNLVLNMCMFTGRQKGKIKPYRVSRHVFRRLADHGQLSGVQRSVW